MKKCAICGESFPYLVVIDGKRRNLASRRFCLKCSPFKKHNTRKLDVILNGGNNCIICGKELKSIRKELCSACSVKIKRIRNKIAAIKYKGGECKKCGKKYRHLRQTASFEFHHKKKDKNFQISYSLDRKSWNKIKKELDKCDLLCSNCHREIHFLLVKNKEFIRKLFNYKGTQDIWIHKTKEKLRPFIR